MTLRYQPVAVTITGDALQNYRRGVVTCDRGYYSISMLLVGATDDEYRLRGSFGGMWGEEGFIRIFNNGNNCGICQHAYTPNV